MLMPSTADRYWRDFFLLLSYLFLKLYVHNLSDKKGTDKQEIGIRNIVQKRYLKLS